jgi:hypothetical protein
MTISRVIMSLMILAGLLIAVAGLLAGLRILSRATNRRTPLEVAELLEAFLDGTISSHEWDDFITIPINDPRLSSIARRCAELPQKFPPDAPGAYCGTEGLEVIRDYARQLRQGQPI